MATLISCPLCRCPIQRTPDGDLTDGIRLHGELVHDLTVPEQARLVRLVSIMLTQLRHSRPTED